MESKGKHIEVTVDLDRPIPQEFIGKVGFNLEFFPVLSSASLDYGRSERHLPATTQLPPDDNPTNYLHTGNYHDGKQSLADMDKLIGKGYSRLWPTTSSANLMPKAVSLPPAPTTLQQSYHRIIER